MRYIFRESHPLEGRDTPDLDKEPIRVTATSEDRARKRLPDPGSGRKWILIETRNSFNS